MAHLSLEILQSMVVFLLVLTMMNGRLMAELAAGEPCVASLSLLRLIRFLNDNTYRSVDTLHIAVIPTLWCTCKSNSFASSFFLVILSRHSTNSSYISTTPYSYTWETAQNIIHMVFPKTKQNLTSNLKSYPQLNY